MELSNYGDRDDYSLVSLNRLKMNNSDEDEDADNHQYTGVYPPLTNTYEKGLVTPLNFVSRFGKFKVGGDKVRNEFEIGIRSVEERFIEKQMRST
jgi:hypothetical protein